MSEAPNCELTGSVNAYKEIKFAFHRLNFGDVDMKVADRVSLELLPLGPVTLDIRQARDAMPLKAPM